MKEEKGVTLIALIITIILLLILVGISLNFALGNNGMIGKSKKAAFKTEILELQEEFNLDKIEYYDDEGNLNEYVNSDVYSLEKVKFLSEEQIINMESGLAEIQDMLQRMKELEYYVINSIILTSEIGYVNSEMNQLLKEIDVVAKDELNLLNGSYDENFTSTVISLGLNNLNLSLEHLDLWENDMEITKNAIAEISKKRITLGWIYFYGEKWTGKLKRVDNQFIYYGNDENERKWATEMGLEVQ